MKLDAARLGIALGIVWGGGGLLLGWAAAAFGWGTPIVELAGTLYIGFAPTPAGASPEDSGAWLTASSGGS